MYAPAAAATTTDVVSSTAEMLTIMRTRLKDLIQEREEVAKQIEKQFAALKKEPAAGAKSAKGNPRDAGKIDEELDELHHRQSQGVSLAEEKKILARMEVLRKALAVHGRREELVNDIDALKPKLNQIKKSIAEIEEQVKRLELLSRMHAGGLVNATADDLTSQTVTVEEDKIGRVVGSKFSNLHNLENEFLVAIRKDDNKLIVTGAAGSVTRAITKIEEITTEQELDVPVSSHLRQLLLTSGGSLRKSLEEGHGVRISLVKEQPEKMHLRGGARGVAAVRAAIVQLEKSKITIPVSTRMVPALIGKKGATIRALCEETGVGLDISDPAEAKSADPATRATLVSNITLCGLPESLAAAAARLQALINENTEHYLTVEVEPDMASYVVGPSGARVREFQKTHNVSATVERAEYDDQGRISKPAAVILRGVREALDAALEGLKVMKVAYARENATISLNTAQARALIGKSGATIARIRQETGASIDLDAADAPAGGKRGEKGGAAAAAAAGGEANGDGERGGRRRGGRRTNPNLLPGQALVHIRGTEAQVIAATAAINALIAAFTSVDVTVTDSTIVALLANSGEKIAQITATTGATIDVVRGKNSGRGSDSSKAAALPESGIIRISGERPVVEAARAAVLEVAEQNVEIDVVMSDADFAGALVGKGGDNIRKLQADTGASVDVHKPTLTIRCKGVRAAAEGAARLIRAQHDAYAKENALVKIPTDCLPAFIGRSGANVKAIEERTGASIGVRGNLVRITGPEEAVRNAVAIVKETAGIDREVDEVPVAADLAGALIGRGGATMTRLQEEHDVILNLSKDRSKLVIRGSAEAIAGAKAAVLRILRDAVRVEAKVDVPVAHLGAVLGRGGVNVRRLQSDLGVLIDIPKKSANANAKTIPVTVRGRPETVEHGRAVLEAMASNQDVTLYVLLPGHLVYLTGRAERSVDRLRDSSGARIVVDSVAGIVRVSGNEYAVTSALSGLETYLRMEFQAAFQRVEVPAGLMAIIAAEPNPQRGGGARDTVPGAAPETKGEDDGDAPAVAGAEEIPTLSAISASTGAQFAVNMRSNYVLVFSEAAATTAAGVAALAAAAEVYGHRNAEIAVQTWMLPVIVGKSGANVRKLEEATGAKVNIDKTLNPPRLLITGPSRAVVDGARAHIGEFIQSLGVQSTLAVSQSGIGALLGTRGATIRKLEEDSGANITLDKESSTVTIRGSAEKVAAARTAIEALLATTAGARIGEASSRTLHADRRGLIAVIGKAGATIQALERDTGARIKVDQEEGEVRISGSDEAVEAASAAVSKILAAASATREGEGERGDRAPSKGNAPASAAAPAAEAAAPPTAPGAGSSRVPVGLSPEDMEAAKRAGSKNAAKRARRKARKGDEEEDGGAENPLLDLPSDIGVGIAAPRGADPLAMLTAEAPRSFGRGAGSTSAAAPSLSSLFAGPVGAAPVGTDNVYVSRSGFTVRL